MTTKDLSWPLAEKEKAVRAKVEHPFLGLKRLFGYGKVRYRGLAKNMGRLALLFGLGNLLTADVNNGPKLSQKLRTGIEPPR